MRKLLILAVASIMLASCSQSLTDKAQNLIAEDIESSVVASDTYEVIETKVDSAYAPLENPELYKLFDKYVKSYNEIREHNEMVADMQFKMGKFTDMYSDELIARLSPIVKSLENTVSIMENMDRMMDMPEDFVGYKAIHTYTTNENGKNVEHKDVYLFNKDMSSIEFKIAYKNYVFVNEELHKMKSNIKETIENYIGSIEKAKKLIEE